MVSEKIIPPPHLAPYIKSYMVKEVKVVRDDVYFPAVSNGYCMFHYGNEYDMVFRDGKTVPIGRTTLSGMTTGFLRFVKDGVQVKWAGAELQPLSPYLMIGDEVNALVNDTITDPSRFTGFHETWRSIKESITTEEKIEAMNSFFTELFKDKPAPDQYILRVLDKMTSPGEFATIDSQLQAFDQGARNFRRKFKRLMGIPPKVYMRIQRMERVLREIYANPDMEYLSKTYGFYDQSHFIRECKTLTGRTPKQIIGAFMDTHKRKYHANLDEVNPEEKVRN